MKKLKKMWASLFIPKNSPYCHHKFKKSRKYGMCAKPCKYLKIIYTSDNEPVEYCKLLNQILDIQDQVKDCGINDDFVFLETKYTLSDLHKLQQENQQLKELISNNKRISNVAEKRYEKILELEQENKILKIKYNKALRLLTDYNLPCDIDEFNTKEENIDYCSQNCSVDENIYLKCWDRYIEQELKEVE